MSVILTSYNRPETICESVYSIQAQTYSNWELFIVDDNSNDETKAVLNHIAAQEPRCTIIDSGVKDEDRGKTTRYATCINLAIPKITGELVTYLTDDDIFYPQRFEKMVQVFKDNPSIYVVYGKQRVVTLRQGAVIDSFIRPLVGITRSPACQIDHNSIMHRRSCFDIVKAWDDHPIIWPLADAVFFTKLAEHWSFYPIDFITDEHRMHEDSVQFRLWRGEKPWGKNE